MKISLVNYSFYSPDFLRKLELNIPVTRIKNPVGEEFSIMRPSLIPSLLKNVEFNLKHGRKRVRIFELRNIYDDQGKETLMLTGLISGTRYPLNWGLPEIPIDFYDIKGIVLNLFRQLNFKEDEIELKTLSDISWYQPGQFSEIEVKRNSLKIGTLGKIRPKVLEAFDVDQPIYLFEINVSHLKVVFRAKKVVTFISKFPPAYRDLSILIPTSSTVHYKDLHSHLLSQGAPFLKEVELFDLYKGSSIPEGYQSMTFSLRYHSDERTLQDEQVNQIHSKICQSLEKRWQIKIR